VRLYYSTSILQSVYIRVCLYFNDTYFSLPIWSSLAMMARLSPTLPTYRVPSFTTTVTAVVPLRASSTSLLLCIALFVRPSA